MLNTLLSPFLSKLHPLFILPGKVAVYGPSPLFGTVRQARPRMETAMDAEDLVSIFSRIRDFVQPGPEDVWLVGLPLKFFTLVHLKLPAAAKDELDHAVRYALLRHVPFDLSEARTGYAHVPSPGGGLALDVSVARNEHLDSSLAALDRAGIHVSGVFPALAYVAVAHGLNGIYISADEASAEAIVVTGGRITFHAWDDLSMEGGLPGFLKSIKPMLDNLPHPPDRVFTWECATSPDITATSLGFNSRNCESITPSLSGDLLKQVPFRIRIHQPEAMRRRKLARRLGLGLAATFLLALSAIPLGELLGKKAYLQTLDAEITRIRPQAEDIAEKRREAMEMISFLERIALEVEEQPAILEILHELTQTLPGNAWLDSFAFAQNRIRVQGQADSATSIIEALENSALFRDVRLESPVTRAHNRDVFHISADVE